MPIALGLPIIFFGFTLFWIYIGFFANLNWVDSNGEPDPMGGRILCLTLCIVALGTALVTLYYAVWRIEIQENKLICRGMFPWQTFELVYEMCNIGLDYHGQNGGRMWWIYICEGIMPKYKPGNPANRINSLKIKPGFVKIMYSDEVYDALLTSLPKKQKTGLETARRYAGFEKQSKIL